MAYFFRHFFMMWVGLRAHLVWVPMFPLNLWSYVIILIINCLLLITAVLLVWSYIRVHFSAVWWVQWGCGLESGLQTVGRGGPGPRVILHSTLHTLSTPNTPHSTLHTSEDALPTLFTPHSVLYTLYSTLNNQHSPLHTPHFRICTTHTLHATLCTLYSELHTQHPHSTLNTPQYALYPLHSTLHILHSKLCTQQSKQFTTLTTLQTQNSSLFIL